MILELNVEKNLTAHCYCPYKIKVKDICLGNMKEDKEMPRR